VKYFCEIHDRCEGVVKYFVEADGEATAYEEAEIHAAELGCCDVGEIIIYEADFEDRERFEAAAYAYYLARRAGGTIVEDTSEAFSPESLLWRHPDGEYGVAAFNSAWWGWQAAVESAALFLSEKDRRFSSVEAADESL